MAIVNFSHDKADAQKRAGEILIYWDSHHEVWCWKEHEGFCVRDRERNGYNDSDFLMLIFNPDHNGDDDMFREIEFATTRGWSYPAMASSVDAGPEILAKYEDWKARRLRQYKRSQILEQKRMVLGARHKIARTAGVAYSQIMDLSKAVSSKDLILISLLFGARVRSKFKVSLRQQVVEWMMNGDREYETPLSARQMRCLLN